jgi:hypothetical protein
LVDIAGVRADAGLQDLARTPSEALSSSSFPSATRAPCAVQPGGESGGVYLTGRTAQWGLRLPSVRRTLQTAVASAAIVATSAAVVASARAASTAGTKCSDAAAAQAVAKYQPTQNGNPVAQVLCGAFTGQGSDAMVVLFSHATGCRHFRAWTVFTYAGGGWKELFTRNETIVSLAAAGSDIREVVRAYKVHAPRCAPATGNASSLWRWNGSQLTVSPQETPTPTGRTLHLRNFFSPDREVWCGIENKASIPWTDVWCGTPAGQVGARIVSASLTKAGAVALCLGTGRATHHCNTTYNSTTATLNVGQSDELDGFRCASETDGITCVVTSGAGEGKGFTINAKTASPVG